MGYDLGLLLMRNVLESKGVNPLFTDMVGQRDLHSVLSCFCRLLLTSFEEGNLSDGSVLNSLVGLPQTAVDFEM